MKQLYSLLLASVCSAFLVTAALAQTGDADGIDAYLSFRTQPSTDLNPPRFLFTLGDVERIEYDERQPDGSFRSIGDYSMSQTGGRITALGRNLKPLPSFIDSVTATLSAPASDPRDGEDEISVVSQNWANGSPQSATVTYRRVFSQGRLVRLTTVQQDGFGNLTETYLRYAYGANGLVAKSIGFQNTDSLGQAIFSDSSLYRYDGQNRLEEVRSFGPDENDMIQLAAIASYSYDGRDVQTTQFAGGDGNVLFVFRNKFRGGELDTASRKSAIPFFPLDGRYTRSDNGGRRDFREYADEDLISKVLVRERQYFRSDISGLSDQLILGLKLVAPNPIKAGQEISFAFTDLQPVKFASMLVTIQDPLMRTVCQGGVAAMSIWPSLPQGLYVLTVSAAGYRSFSKKFVVVGE